MKQANSVLIVDDELGVIRAIRRVLSTEEYELFETTDPREAIQILKDNDIDVILSDNRMPGLTGIELLMQSKQISPNTVRILMSAYSDFEVVIAAVNDGAIFHYIVKPWSNEKMIEIIRNAMEYKCEQQEKEQIINSLLQNKTEWTDLVGQLNNKIHSSQEKAVRALLKVLEVKDRDLYVHSQHVTEIGLKIADALQLSEQQKEYVKLGGLFHDIGKISIRDNILYKQGKLDSGEFNEMKNHPAVGAEILKELDFLQHISNIVLQHHERMDGRGYPAGIAGEEILLEARIIAIADSYDALVADRVYRKGMTQEEAIAILRQASGSHYDEELLNAFTNKVLRNADAVQLSAG